MSRIQVPRIGFPRALSATTVLVACCFCIPCPAKDPPEVPCRLMPLFGLPLERGRLWNQLELSLMIVNRRPGGVGYKGPNVRETLTLTMNGVKEPHWGLGQFEDFPDWIYFDKDYALVSEACSQSFSLDVTRCFISPREGKNTAEFSTSSFWGSDTTIERTADTMSIRYAPDPPNTPIAPPEAYSSKPVLSKDGTIRADILNSYISFNGTVKIDDVVGSKVNLRLVKLYFEVLLANPMETDAGIPANLLTGACWSFQKHNPAPAARNPIGELKLKAGEPCSLVLPTFARIRLIIAAPGDLMSRAFADSVDVDLTYAGVAESAVHLHRIAEDVVEVVQPPR